MASLAALIVPVALSQGQDRDLRKRGKAWAPDTIYNVVSVTGANDASVSFDILASMIKGKDGKVVFMNDSTKRSGTYYFANDTAVIPFASKTDKKRLKPVIVDYSNATINVAGASAVVGLKNISMSGKGKGKGGSNSLA